MGETGQGQEPGASGCLLDSLLAGAQLKRLRIEESRAPSQQPRPVLVLHASARPEAPGCRRSELRAVRAAALAAYRKLLLHDAPATEACEVALRHLEHHFHRHHRQDDQKVQQQQNPDEAATSTSTTTTTTGVEPGARNFYSDAAIIDVSTNPLKLPDRYSLLSYPLEDSE
ncbi:hypothetical protein QAD02_020084 [Eretmocerus hayati]|uniref:Uncharacterized protein n=1 Tax=Eretmocerus hayati TaxID=131215 RepID=A0ACC2PLN5_9HYME|nr:hypothetical protein QAD02_020084 [Eretmocerus hayati]